MATLYKPKLNVTIDLTGVSCFVVKIPYRTKNFTVMAIFACREEAIIWEPDWDRAHLLQRQLHKHVLMEGVDVEINEDSGSIVPV